MKKGFTLLEVVMSVAIISILLSISFVKMTSINKVRNRVDQEMFGNCLVNFINNSREHCRDKNERGIIVFDQKKMKVFLSCKSNKVLQMGIPEGFSIYNVTASNTIKIDNKGFTDDACSIKFSDREGKKHCITICVGTAYADFKY